MIEITPSHQIKLPSKLSSITQIEKFIDDVCESFSIGEDAYGNILIALTEAVNNAITHGNQLDPEKYVNLEVIKESNQLCVTVSDEGTGFDFQNVPDPTLPENIHKTNGRGVFLMLNLAEEVDFQENGSKTTLKFSLSTT